MEQNELKRLMVGDWVYNTHNRQNEQVQEVFCISVMLDYNDIYNSSEIEPIRLHPSTLKKIGFANTEFYSEMLIDGWQIQCDGLHLKAHNMDCSINIKCEYVHQLQQALRLCGIEKEIKL